MEDTDVTFELDKMLENSKKEYNIVLTEQQHDEPTEKQRSETPTSDTETASIILKTQKKLINVPVPVRNNDINIDSDIAKIKKDVLILKDNISILKDDMSTLKDDMGKIVNIFTQMKFEMDTIKQKVNEMESGPNKDDEYHEHIDRVLSVNLDKLKMKLKKSLKKYLVNG